MKKEEVKGLIREYLALRTRTESLQEQLRELENRYEELGDLLYGCRSKSFIRSVLYCLADMGREYEKDGRYDDFFTSLVRILKDFEEYDADRRNYTPPEQLPLYDEDVE